VRSRGRTMDEFDDQRQRRYSAVIWPLLSEQSLRIATSPAERVPTDDPGPPSSAKPFWHSLR
jgi:hypothetical protein